MGRQLLFNARIFPLGTALASTGVIVSPPLITKNLTRPEAIWYQGTSISGTAEFKIEMAAAGEANFTDALSNIAFGAYTEIVASAANEVMTRFVLPTANTDGAQALIFRVTGTGSNPADTLFTAWVTCREEVGIG